MAFKQNYNDPSMMGTGQEDFLMQSFMPNAMPSAQADGLIKWQLEPADVIEDIEHYLKGEVWTNKGWQKHPAMQIVNDRGVNKFLILLRGHLSKVMSMSNLKRSDIYEMCEAVELDVIDQIYLNHQAYEIDESNFNTLPLVIGNAVKCFLLQAEDGKLLQFLQTSERFIENRREAMPEHQGGGGGGVFNKIKNTFKI